MDQKFQMWFKQIDGLSQIEKDNEIKIIKLEIHNLELRLFIHELIKEIKEKEQELLDIYTKLNKVI